MKNRFFNKILSFLVLSIIFISSLPLNIAFANLQSHIRNLKINSEDEKVGYSIKLGWDNPSWSSVPDSSAVDGTTIHIPEGFKVFERKVNTTTAIFNEVKDEKKADATAMLLKSINLDEGAIYEYKVLPYHNHTYIQNGTNVTRPAPMDPNDTEESVLFMTDIKVDAQGSGNSLNVTFDNPKFGGKNIFTGYKIYYQKGGQIVTTFNSEIEVGIDNKELVESYDATRGANRLTYKITNNNIVPGEIYAVKVEPIYNGREIRTENNPTVVIDKLPKKIGFNSIKFKEYRTNDAHVAISLSVSEDGKDNLKLTWGDLSNIANTVSNIEYIKVYFGEKEDEISNLKGTVYSADAVNIHSWKVERPNKKTYYQIKVKVAGVQKTINSEIAVFDPSIVNITPNSPGIYPKNNIKDNKSVIDIYWDTFIRPAYNKQEEDIADPSGMILDKNIEYDLWITDSLENLEKLGLPKILDRVKAINLKEENIVESENAVYHHSADRYFTLDQSGAFISKKIQENKMYYIKIIAIKPTSNGIGLFAPKSETQIYVNSKGDISKPNSLSKPPLRIKKDKNNNDMIEKNEISIEWSRKWFEVFDKKTNSWHTNVAIREGQLIFNNDIKETDKIVKFYDEASQTDVKNLFLNNGYADANKLVLRNIDISQDNIKYEMVVSTIDDINNQGGYENYIENLLNSQSSDWKEIDPNFTEKYADYTIKDLKENTRYAILLRPYRFLEDGRKDAYPTYILATTLPSDPNLDFIPIIPTLKEVSKTDMSIEVEWNNISNGILYELAIDEVLLDDPSKAKNKISSDEIKKNAIPHTKDDIDFLRYNIKNLFPDTGYYVWVRVVMEGSDTAIEWSNPIYSRTDKLKRPNSPSGLGLASEKSIEIYNNANNTKYKPIADKYLTVEWLRDPEDVIQGEKANVDKDSSAEPLLNENIKGSYMVKFNKLLANKTYFVRAKTKIYISQNKDGKIEKSYSYIIQLSNNKSFKDAVEIEIPNKKEIGDKVLTAESDWTIVLSFKTKYSTDGDGDYDGEINPDLYPLPTQDFEIIYEPVKQALIYRFRTNKKDNEGNADNLADQRFITNLINDKVYDFPIDLTSHLGYKIKNRTVEVPYSIISAFEERKISLSITALGSTFKLNPGFLNTSEVKSMGKMGADSTVKINIEENPTRLPILNYNQTYVTTPQSLTISILKGGSSNNLNFVGKDMDIYLKLRKRDLILDNNVSVYRNVGINSNWQKLNSNYNIETGIMNIKSGLLGTYTTISTGIKNIDNTGNLTSVNSKIVLSDLTNTNLKNSISTLQFNNIIAGVANGKTEITINTALSTKDYNSLKSSGMLLQGSVVGREYGISSLVKLYEMKTKAKYEALNNINTTQFKDIKKASSHNKLSLIKAGELGFFGTSALSRPKDTMTIEEMLYIVNIILEDSGY